MPSLFLPYVEQNKKDNKQIVAMDLIHMRRSVISIGRPGGLITEITWKVGRLEVICEHSITNINKITEQTLTKSEFCTIYI